MFDTLFVPLKSHKSPPLESSVSVVSDRVTTPYSLDIRDSLGKPKVPTLFASWDQTTIASSTTLHTTVVVAFRSRLPYKGPHILLGASVPVLPDYQVTFHLVPGERTNPHISSGK